MLVAGASSIAFLSTSAYARRGQKRSTSTGLTEEQKDALFYIYQEEKVARREGSYNHLEAFEAAIAREEA